MSLNNKVIVLSAAPAIKPLVWSDESGPTDKIRYNHITAETALGQFSVEWKGRKEEDVPCVYLAGDYIGVASNLGGAKQLAERHIRELVANLLAASPTPPAEQQAATKAAPVVWLSSKQLRGVTALHGQYLPFRCQPEGRFDTPVYLAEAAPKAAPGVGNSGFDHQTAADFLSGKTISDESVRKFVQASRWAHDEKAFLSAMLLSVRGVLASREAEIALLKRALMEAEAAPQQEAQERLTCAHRIADARNSAVESGYLCVDCGAVFAAADHATTPKAAIRIGWGRDYQDNGKPIDASVAPVPNLALAPQQEAQEPVKIPESIERMATDRYKVVPSHESMFHRWAVVAGSGTQQLYLGREVECQNMARKFAGAFLDGAFFAMQQPAPKQERIAFKDAHRHLDLDEVQEEAEGTERPRPSPGLHLGLGEGRHDQLR